MRRGPRTNGLVKMSFMSNNKYNVPSNYVDNLLYGFNFSLNQFGDDAINLISIYDEYKITRVRVTIRPDFLNRTGSTPMEVLCHDSDDSNITGQTYTDLCQYSGARVGMSGYKTISFRPKFMMTGAVTGGTDLIRPASGWLDSKHPDVPYYGWKTGYQNNYTNPTSFVVNYQTKIWVMYRNKR